MSCALFAFFSTVHAEDQVFSPLLPAPMKERTGPIPWQRSSASSTAGFFPGKLINVAKACVGLALGSARVEDL